MLELNPGLPRFKEMPVLLGSIFQTRIDAIAADNVDFGDHEEIARILGFVLAWPRCTCHGFFVVGDPCYPIANRRPQRPRCHAWRLEAYRRGFPQSHRV